jgi:hypothetical protein
MNRPREESLSGAGLAQDEDGRQATGPRLASKQLRHLAADGYDPRALSA